MITFMNVEIFTGIQSLKMQRRFVIFSDKVPAYAQNIKFRIVQCFCAENIYMMNNIKKMICT